MPRAFTRTKIRYPREGSANPVWVGGGGGGFDLASTRPVSFDVTLTGHVQPKVWESGFVTPLLSRTFSRLVLLTAFAVHRSLARSA